VKPEPADDDKLDREYGESLIAWSDQYNAYTRLAAPDALELVLAPFEEALGVTGEIPKKAGIDLLRGWAFDIASWHKRMCTEEFGAEISAPVHRCHPLLGLIVLALLANPAASEADLPPSRPDGVAEFETDPRVFQRVQFYVDQKPHPRRMFRIHAGSEAPLHVLREAIIESWEPSNLSWHYTADLKPWKVGKGNAIFWTKSKSLGEQRWELIDHSEIDKLLY
jgi:hypothetical protein